MRIALVYVGTTLNAIGLRLVAAAVRCHFAQLELFFVMPTSRKNLWHILFDTTPDHFSAADVAAIAEELAPFDVIGFSGMSENAEDIQQIIQGIRVRKTGAYIVWGGTHAILDPEEAIQHADAVCTGEGEQAFPDLLLRLEAGTDYFDCANFWFRDKNDLIVKSPKRTQAEPTDLEQLPFPEYSYVHEKVYRKNRQRFTSIARNDFLHSDALAYTTIWTRGCPFSCIYCCNSRLNQMSGSSRIRYSSVDRMIAEIQHVRVVFPHISTVRFADDSFISLPLPILREFAAKWPVEVNLPFWVFGANPLHVKEEKLSLLVKAGMIGIRVGLQSGSERILEFYRRRTRPHLYQDVSAMVARYIDYIIPPIYDIILDNPVETAEDVAATLRLVNELPRPVIVTLYSLRSIPNTDLMDRLEQLGIDVPSMEKRRYFTVNPTWPNVLMSVAIMFHIPDALFARALPWVLVRREIRPGLELPLLFLRLLSLIQLAVRYIRRLDFSIVFGRIGWLLYKIGLLQFAWRRSMEKRKTMDYIPKKESSAF